MSGSFRVEAAETTTPGAFHHERSKDPKHDHVVLHLDNGKTVTYNDPRRFGFMDLVASDALSTPPEADRARRRSRSPPNSTPRVWRSCSQASRAPLKAALLDQKRIAGLGNIYVCEALFRARLSALRPAGVLADAAGKPTPRGREPRQGHPRRSSRRRSRRAARPCATIARRTATSAISSIVLQSTTGRGCRCLRPRCGGTVGASRSPAGRPSIVPRCQK